MRIKQFYDLIEDIVYQENGQWVWSAMSEFDRIELKIDNQQFKIQVVELSLQGYPAHFF